MKTKTNKEIIEEFDKKFYPFFNGLAAVDGPRIYDKYDEIKEFMTKALEQKEREVEEKYTQRVRELEKANKSLSKVALKNY